MRNCRKLIVCLVAVGAFSVAGAGTAFATQHGLDRNFNNGGQTGNQSNCVAAFTNQWIHNGVVVRGQDRQSEMQDHLQLCAHD